MKVPPWVGRALGVVAAFAIYVGVVKFMFPFLVVGFSEMLHQPKPVVEFSWWQAAGTVGLMVAIVALIFGLPIVCALAFEKVGAWVGGDQAAWGDAGEHVGGGIILLLVVVSFLVR